MHSSSIDAPAPAARSGLGAALPRGAPSPRSRNLCRAVILVLAAVSSGGCYLLQSARGQLALMSKRRPIGIVIADSSTPRALRRELEAVASIRDFASRELDLPDNGSYLSYADIGRPYVVWNVVAAPEFSVDPKQWCYPIVGCVTYRGYFSEAAARRYAARLRDQGFDVSVGGVAAYSTLGHFDDPVLSTMTGWTDTELASIIFHELTHQLLYLRDDTSFNEAFATAVEEEGVRRWLHAQGRDAQLEAERERQSRYVEVVERLTQTRAALRAIYASNAAPARMREQKRGAFAALRQSLEALRARWGGHAQLEAWLSTDLNNAHLASIATYFSCVPGFERELQSAQGDLPAFYARVRRLAKLDKAARDARLCADPGASVDETQLDEQLYREHDGDCEQPLCQSYGGMDLVHDALLRKRNLSDRDRLRCGPAGNKRIA